MGSVIDRVQANDGSGAGRTRRPLLSSCALAAALVVAAHPRPVQGQAFNAVNATPTQAGSTVATTSATSTTVSVTAAESIITWEPNATATSANGGTGTIDFMPSTRSITFESGYGYTGGYTVLNIINSTTAPTRPIGLDGTVNSTVNGARGGNIWFYSPGGIVAGSGSAFNVGSLVLTSNAIDTTGGLYGSGSTIRFRGPASTSTVSFAGTANLTAANSYLAIVAPRVFKSGTVNVNGSVGYVAAEQADVSVNAGFFSINVSVGTAGAAPTSGAPGGVNVIQHSGDTITSGTNAGNGKTYFVAVPKNDAITMLVSGNLGYASATSAGVENGAVVLAAGYRSVSTSGTIDTFASAPPAGTASNLTYTGGTINAATVDARARNSATFDTSVAPVTINGAVNLNGRDALLAANNGRNVTIVGNTRVQTQFRATGTAAVTVGAGSTLDLTGNLDIFAGENGYGASVQAATASLTASGAGAIARVSGNLYVDASIDNNQTGGNAIGGIASVNSLLGGSVRVEGTTRVYADASGGSSGGSGTGGTASVIGDGGSLTLLGAVEIRARGDSESGFSSGNAGTATGGATRFTTTMADDTIGALTLYASGVGANAENGYGAGNGNGGTVEIRKAGTGSATIASINAQAEGIGGSAVTSAGGAGGSGGTGTGGAVSLTVAGGTLIVPDSGYGTILSTSAFGGDGGPGENEATGGIGGSAAAGNGARGVLVSIEGGSASLGVTTLSSTATGGSGGAGDAEGFGGVSGGATGGSAIVRVGTGTGSALEASSLTLDVHANGGDFSEGGYGQSAAGGGAVGGSATIEALGGTLDGGYLSVDAYAEGGAGGDGSNGGAATGGSILVSAERGSATFASSSIDVDASGGFGQNGTASADAAAGTITVRTTAVAAPGTFGSLSLGDTSLSASAFSSGGTSTAGRIAIADNGPGATSMTFGSLYVQASGQQGSATQIFDLAANNGAIAVLDYAYIAARGVSIAATGSGGLDVGNIGAPDGDFSDFFEISTPGTIAISHSAPTRSTIRADTIYFSAGDSIVAGAGSVLDSGGTIDLFADNRIAVAEMRAAGSITATTELGNIEIGIARATGEDGYGESCPFFCEEAVTTPPGAGASIVLTAGNGDPAGPDILIGSEASATGNVELDASRDILISNGATVVGDEGVIAVAGRDIGSAGGIVRSGGDIDISVGRNLTLGTLDATGSINTLENGYGGGSVTENLLLVPGSVSITGLLSTGESQSLTAETGSIGIGSAGIAGDLALLAAGTVNAQGLQVDGQVTAQGSTVSLGAPNDLRVDSALARTNIDVRAGGDLTVREAVTSDTTTSQVYLAGGYPFVSQPGGSYVLTGDLTVTGVVSSGNLTHLDGGGDVFLQNGAQVRSNGTIEVHSGDDIFVRGGAVVGGGVSSGAANTVLIEAGLLRFGRANLTANGTSILDIAGTVGGRNIGLFSEDIAIGGAALVGDNLTTRLALENNSRTSATTVGGAGTATGYALSNDEFGRLTASQIEIYAPDNQDEVADLTIGRLDVIGSAGADTATRRRNLTGSTLLFDSEDELLVDGPLSITSAGPNEVLSLVADFGIGVDTGTGSISITGANNALAGTLQLTSDLIYVGSRSTGEAIAETEEDGTIADRKRLLDNNDGTVNAAGYIQAGGLVFRPGTGLYIQNTGPNNSNPDSRAGSTAGSGGVSILRSTSNGSSQPVEVVINGRQTSGDGGYITGAELIPQIKLNENGYGTLLYDPGSTVNSCLLSGGSCARSEEGPPVQDIIGFDPTANLLTLIETPLIELADFTSFALEPLIDDPVTGAGNDDLWLNGGDDEDEDEKPTVTSQGEASPRG